MSQHAEPAGRLYAFLRLVARFWIWFLFREIAVRAIAHVPPAGPVLLCVNHPNNLIDSLLVAVAVPRKVHFLANATLFRNRALGALLARGGAIPVHRRQESPGNADRNAETFLAARHALEAGHLLAIYPEGTTHAERRVQRIKTGAARIALDYEAARRADGAAALAPLTVLPVGLSFESRKSFGGRVLVAFGPPIDLGPHVRRAGEDPIAAVQGLTDAIQRAMEAEVVHVDRIDVAEVVRAGEELYRDELIRQLRVERGLPAETIDPFRLSRSIVEAVVTFRDREPERVAHLWQRIQHYRARLTAWHVRDQAVGARLSAERPPHRLRWSTAAVLGLPVFLYGSAVNALPYLIPRWLARTFARRETDYATIRLLSSIVAFPVGWALEIWLVHRLAGTGWAIAFAMSLPLTGLVAYHYLRGLGRLRARTGFALLALTHRTAAARLLAERRAIMAELERAKRDFLTARGLVPPSGPAPRVPTPEPPVGAMSGARRGPDSRPLP
jgi:1-acyl-sn-glycerol-3-phosphate acyltransferase